MLEYMSGIAYVSFIALVIGTPTLALALYLSPRITSLPARMAVVWPLFALGVASLAFVTLLLAGHLYGVLYMAARQSLGW